MGWLRRRGRAAIAALLIGAPSTAGAQARGGGTPAYRPVTPCRLLDTRDLDGTSSRTVMFGNATVPDGLDAAYRIRGSDPMWNDPTVTWVIALGTNDVGFSAGNLARSHQYVAEMRAAIGPKPITWMNVRTGRADWQYQEARFNQSIISSGVQIIDWHSSMDDSWLAGDRVHLTTAGYQGRADLLGAMRHD